MVLDVVIGLFVYHVVIPVLIGITIAVIIFLFGE